MKSLGVWAGAIMLALGMKVAVANDDLAAMKASMEKMQAEMATRDAQIEALQSNLSAMRMQDFAAAGGEPAKLQSANGKATIRIGGEMRLRYMTGWANGYNRASPEGTPAGGTNTTNFKSQTAGWALSRAQLTFDIDLSADTSARFGLRFEGGSNGSYADGGNIINEAWWKWKNVGGVDGWQLMAGYMYIPFGMSNNNYDLDVGAYNWNSTSNGIITNPFVMRDASEIFNYGDQGLNGLNVRPNNNGALDKDFNTAGVLTAYQMFDKQLTVKAGIFASQINLVGRGVNNPGVNQDNVNRNIGLVNHVINISYNPCWIEGLHVEASYMGMFDQQRGATDWNNGTNPYGAAQNLDGRTTYRPSFDFGIFYKTGNWKFYAEYLATVYSGFRNGAFGNALSAGADYSITKRWMISGEFDWMHYSQDETLHANNNGGFVGGNYDIYRAAFGTRYELASGLTFQLQYLHDWMRSGYRLDGIKDADAIWFQTSYKF